jgi:hypothetical protein
VIFIMGSARAGSTLLGTILAQAEGVFYAGELSEWPHLDGVSTVPRSLHLWERVRKRVGPLPDEAVSYRRLFEHPQGLGSPLTRRRLRNDYERITYEVLQAVVAESGCATIVDSSHYPRRASALRRLLGRHHVRLVYLVRRPSAVARSFAKTADKGLLGINLYLMAVGLLSWITYLTHPRSQRVIIGYEQMTEQPLATATMALGRPLGGIDPARLPVPPVFVANRFVKTSDHVAVRKEETPSIATVGDRITDLIQWPLRLAQRQAEKVMQTGGSRGRKTAV